MTDRAQDEASIRRLVADVEQGFNANDVERSIAPFAYDAVAVAVTGSLVAGREQLRAAHEQGYAGHLRDQFARYELGAIRFLGEDVAIAHKRAWATDAEGRDLDVGHAMLALYVFQRRSEGWRIVARQNTLTATSPG